MWLEIIFGKVTCAEIDTQKTNRSTERNRVRTIAPHTLKWAQKLGTFTRCQFPETEHYQSRLHITIWPSPVTNRTLPRNIRFKNSVYPDSNLRRAETRSNLVLLPVVTNRRPEKHI
jgi:hypothetical protein